MASIQITIVNDGSDFDISNEAEQILSELEDIRYVEYDKNMGKGFALRKGISAGTSEYTMYTDIDFPYTISDIIKLLKELIINDLAVVVCSRDKTYYFNINVQRKVISRCLLSINKLLFRLPIYDTQGGLKAFNSSGKKIFLETKSNRYLTDLEFIKMIGRAGLTIGKVNARLRKNVEIPKLRYVLLLKEIPAFVRILFS